MDQALLTQWMSIVQDWREAFSQHRTLSRALRLALGSLCTLGRRTLSRAIAATGCAQADRSADYRLFSRSGWQLADLFRPILKRALSKCDEEVIAVAFDDTKLHKTGRKIKSAFWQRDPMSPPFHVNLIWGLRFLQASILLPLYRFGTKPTRAVPIQFEEVPAVKKPGKRATEAERAEYKKAIKVQNLSTAFVSQLKALPEELNHLGYSNKTLLATVDGSFCNSACMNAEIPGVQIIARARKDAALYFRDQAASRGYCGEKITPEGVRRDENIPWQETTIFHGGKWRPVLYKELNIIFWKRGTGKRPLRLIVVAPTPYRLSKNKKLSYRDPAYLLTTDLGLEANLLLQKYFDRWQIEVNFREEKDLLGVGEAQVRSAQSVPRQPGFVVAGYSALLMSSVLVYEDLRNSKILMPLPKWRARSLRPSILDLITQLRREMTSSGKVKAWLRIEASFSQSVLCVAA